MAKISLNIPDELDNIIREYAEENNLNLTNTCIKLLKKGLETKDTKLDDYLDLKENLKNLESENKKLIMKLEDEKQSRIQEYQTIIAQNTQTNQELIELMKADKVLELGKQQVNKEQKKSFFKKIKALLFKDNNINN